MYIPTEVVRRAGGVAATHELLAAGVTSRHLAEAVRAGYLVRPRQGWYVTADLADDMVRAIRVGGRLASVSAAASYGLAVPHEFPLHVHVPHHDSRLRTELDCRIRLSGSLESTTVIHRGPVSPPRRSTRLRVGLDDCLRQVILTEAENDAIACLDSAVRTGAIVSSDIDRLLMHLPQRCQEIAAKVDGTSDGYPESIARLKLSSAGIATRTQVSVLGERWIDLVIGDCLAIEVDGAGKYSQDMTPGEVARRVNADRQRDAFLEALGYHVIRISYLMVMFDWPATLAMIHAVMDRGGHLSRR